MWSVMLTIKLAYTSEKEDVSVRIRQMEIGLGTLHDVFAELRGMRVVDLVVHP